MKLSDDDDSLNFLKKRFDTHERFFSFNDKGNLVLLLNIYLMTHTTF